MNLFEIIFHPDREEERERSEIAEAANALQIGEFQLLQLAYRDWHDQDLPDHLCDLLFHAYMVDGQVPFWARHYARRINQAAELGGLDDQDPDYHRYDDEYVGRLPTGFGRFMLATFAVLAVIGGSVLLSHFITAASTSVLPPYFNEEELKQNKQPNLRGS
jgi:hypothetical protein